MQTMLSTGDDPLCRVLESKLKSMATDTAVAAPTTAEDCLVPEVEDSQYETIGGKSAKIVRRPSLLASIQERGLMQSQRSQSSTPSDLSGSGVNNEAIARWQEDDVMSWLEEIGFEEYKVIINACVCVEAELPEVSFLLLAERDEAAEFTHCVLMHVLNND